MGLDNGFILKDRNHPDVAFEVGYFRNYYELDRWVRENCKYITEDGEGEYTFLDSDCEKLLSVITPIYRRLAKLTPEKISYYDDYGYPKRFMILHHGNDFNPFGSPSAFPGSKLIDLYISLNAISDILYYNKDAYVTFYHSS